MLDCWWNLSPPLHEWTYLFCRRSLSKVCSCFNLIPGGQSPTYLLEHLATFTVSPENDLVYPADGMRRLLAMEKTNGIW